MTRLFIVLALVLGGCKKKVDPAPPARAAKAAETPAALPIQEAVQAMMANFSKVHFAFDASALDEPSKQALAENVRIMQNHPRLRVEVQGHADERGTTDYNVALGDRRARAVKDHMMLLGVQASRIVTVSYGEERPAERATGEAAWSKNRRAEFKILIGESGVSGTTD